MNQTLLRQDHVRAFSVASTYPAHCLAAARRLIYRQLQTAVAWSEAQTQWQTLLANQRRPDLA